MSIFNKDMTLGTISDSYTSTITILYKGKQDLRTETELHTTTFKMFTSIYININIIVVNIPPRHDLAKDSKTNLAIQAYNVKLNKTAKSFRHVTSVEVVSNRIYFTKHSLHLNSIGKELLAKLIATQTDELINNIYKTEPVIALN